MKKISIFYDGSPYTFRWLKALLWAEKELNRFDVSVSFISLTQYLPLKRGRRSLSSVLATEKVDAFFIAHHHSYPGGLGPEPLEAIATMLGQLRSQSEMIVWADTADSSGTCRFDVLPYVDVYLKKQLLKDRTRYFHPIWGGRTFCEYYHSKYELADPEISAHEYPILDEQYAQKVRVGWNVGLSDIHSPNRYASYLRPRSYWPPRWMAPSAPRTLDVHFRGSPWSSVAGWQRAKVRELLHQRVDLRYPDPDSRVSRADYLTEMRESRAVVSPFGWGEICSRDFEAFASGATVLKPDMSHMETFPDWYVSNETYIAIDWDFKNFDEVLDGIGGRADEYLSVAKNARSMYENFLVGGGKRLFAEHLLRSLGWL